MKVFLHRITVTLLHFDFQFLLRNEWDEILYYILYKGIFHYGDREVSILILPNVTV